jgi:hypothetical protein
MVKPPLRTKSIGFKVSQEEYAQLETAAQADGSVQITREVAGQTGGRAAYEQVVNAAGQTASVVQKAYDAVGNLVHYDPKFP